MTKYEFHEMFVQRDISVAVSSEDEQDAVLAYAENVLNLSIYDWDWDPNYHVIAYDGEDVIQYRPSMSFAVTLSFDEWVAIINTEEEEETLIKITDLVDIL